MVIEYVWVSSSVVSRVSASGNRHLLGLMDSRLTGTDLKARTPGSDSRQGLAAIGTDLKASCGLYASVGPPLSKTTPASLVRWGESLQSTCPSSTSTGPSTRDHLFLDRRPRVNEWLSGPPPYGYHCISADMTTGNALLASPIGRLAMTGGE